MRLRRLRRRFALTGPRLAVRRAMPWPLRWLAAALVLGLSAAVALWAFEFGKSLAGLDAGARQSRVLDVVAERRHATHPPGASYCGTRLTFSSINDAPGSRS